MSAAAELPLTRADGLVNTGARLFQEGQLEPARLHFLAALGIEPSHTTALQNLSACLRNLNHTHAAFAIAKKAVKLTAGENVYCLSNLGVAQLGMRQYREAAKTLAQVAKALPEAAPSWQNLGLVYYMMGQYLAALDAFDKSLALTHNEHCDSDRALTILSLGRLKEGLEAYECRWRVLYRTKVWDFGLPEWRGEDLEGNHILVHHEQGFGDSIMLCRFLRHLETKKCRITLATQPSLVRLMQNNFRFIRVLSLEDPDIVEKTIGVDYHSPLLSVMRWLGYEKPEQISPKPYLTAETKPPITLPNTKIKIGICWASGDHTPALRDRRRLVPLPLFLPLLDNTDISLIALQKGGDERDISTYGLESIVFDFHHKLEDWQDTANTIMCLDLVITVDSAIAHLTGSLGKPCIMLSPYTRCWRWWGKASGWPWYERMAIYPQESDGTWNKPMADAIKRALWVVKEV